MKRIFWMTLLGLGAVALGGCPIYPDNGSHRYCDYTGCYSCPDNTYSDSCVGWQCNGDSDCPQGYSCNADNVCSSGGDGGVFTPDASPGCASNANCPSGQSCGADDQCHPGDCTSNGCPAPLVCKLSGGSPQCVSLGADGGTVHPDSGTDAPPFTGCNNDSECIALGPGAKCLDGTCVAAANQCSDTTQCPNSESCVNGVCTPACSGSMPCPTGYSCNIVADGGSSGVCSGNPNPCGSGGQTCPGGTTCVDQHCVQPCSPTGTCPTGEVCVDNGCVPNQKPQFVCNVDGQAGDGQPGDCAVGSLCLHHSCYIACDPEAGATACKTADQFNQCKSVTTSGGSYYVCGSATNLGGECDPTQGKACANSSDVCVDGYCK
jgi:hypothetical protein